MADLVDILIDILCQQGTQSKCQQFIASYPDITQQLVWLVFFPTVFMLIFVYILASGVTRQLGEGGHKKFQTLLAIALCIFVVFQGWYHYTLTLSRFWFIAVIVVSGFFVLIHKMGGVNQEGSGNSTEKRTKALKSQGLGKGVGSYALRTVLGEQKRELAAIKDLVKRRKQLEGKVVKYLKEPDIHKMDMERTDLALTSIDNQLKEKFGAYRLDPVIGHEVRKIEKELAKSQAA